MLSQAPRACKPLHDRTQHKLLRMARSNSECFARSMMTTTGEDNVPPGLEFVTSLNGIDVYEDTAHMKAKPGILASTRLRSVCHLEADIHDVVRRLTTTISSSRLLPGIVETHELCSVLNGEPTERMSGDKEFPEQAGVNWFVLDQTTTRDSTSLSRSGVFGSRSSSIMGTSTSCVEGVPVEFLVLAYQGLFKHRGRRGWVQWCQSIELSNFPVTEEHCKRGILFSSGIVAVESASRPGHVSMYYAMGLDLSCYSNQQRRFLENAVWKRVMKLAALKKSMSRESLARTLSISSAENERFSHSSLEESPKQVDAKPITQREQASPIKSRVVKQPECEPKINHLERPSDAVPTKQKKYGFMSLTSKIQELRSESKAKPSHPEKRRVRAQTMEPTSSVSRPQHQPLFRDPDSLEFRLTLYDDPDPLEEDEPHSPTEVRSSRDVVSSHVGSAFPPTKRNRPKSKSLGNGWVL